VFAPQVYLNGTRLPIKTFVDYCDMYLGPKDNGVPRIYERVNDRWEICVSATDGQFQQVSMHAGPTLSTTEQPAESTSQIGPHMSRHILTPFKAAGD
jgi:hypothetical protein